MKSIVHRFRSVCRVCAWTSLSFFWTLTAQAHDPGLSTATVTVGAQKINVVLGFALQDAAFILPENRRPADAGRRDDFQAMRPELESVIASSFNLYLGEQLAVPVQITAQAKDSNNVEILLEFTRSKASQLRLLSAFLERLPFGHREFLSVQAENGATLAEAMLSAKKSAFLIGLPAIAAPSVSTPDGNSFFAFLKLGVEHILTGYDHLLFLFALMVVCRDLRSILSVITCFTIAHSISLALATLDIVRLPGRIVEPLIAASIVYVGIENLVRGDSPKWRNLIAFSFGLVHGLGFADALRELGISSGRFGFVVPLVGFNLGVELGQLCVAAVVLPILWHFRRNPSFVRRLVPVCSLAVAFAGSYWMVERVLQR
jgi:hydrogenase/urease accessory protein HupE